MMYKGMHIRRCAQNYSSLLRVSAEGMTTHNQAIITWYGTELREGAVSDASKKGGSQSGPTDQGWRTSQCRPENLLTGTWLEAWPLRWRWNAHAGDVGRRTRARSQRWHWMHGHPEAQAEGVHPAKTADLVGDGKRH
eukprot:6334916-Amphidinium_carterae.1